MVFINHQASTEDVLKWADMVMYQAKEAGRNLVQFYKNKFERWLLEISYGHKEGTSLVRFREANSDDRLALVG